MGKGPVPQSIFEIIAPVIRKENLELVDVEYKRAGRNWILRVFIDREGGVTLEDCQKVSHLVGDLIEIEEIVSNAYVLEVSSPGLDRPLKTERDYLKYKSKKITVNTFSPIDNRRHFRGIVSDFKDDTLHLEENGKLLQILLENISLAKPVIEI
ncbi:MAG: ribosome maturation factor RimP [Nitrospinae bacterium CG11_big_fil_rev_8_21_14_0_20_56_8]|nr:MAG: ribosome maturation factor RimP [Nitrospinae bacterium CG11_big_fil_rev_8_21_14_0_20_56_8]